MIAAGSPATNEYRPHRSERSTDSRRMPGTVARDRREQGHGGGDVGEQLRPHGHERPFGGQVVERRSVRVDHGAAGPSSLLGRDVESPGPRVRGSWALLSRFRALASARHRAPRARPPPRSCAPRHGSAMLARCRRAVNGRSHIVGLYSAQTGSVHRPEVGTRPPFVTKGMVEPGCGGARTPGGRRSGPRAGRGRLRSRPRSDRAPCRRRGATPPSTWTRSRPSPRSCPGVSTSRISAAAATSSRSARPASNAPCVRRGSSRAPRGSG